MKCESFQDQAMDWARRGALPPEAESHRTVCSECALAWDRELALSRCLADLQDVSGPTAALESAVVRAWSSRRRVERRWAPAAMAAVAAALLLAVVLPRWESQPPAAAQVAIDFLPLRAGPVLAPGESAQLVRIRLRRSEARRFGLPVSMDGDGQAVDAEVWIGEDGAARAVRFIPVTKE